MQNLFMAALIFLLNNGYNRPSWQETLFGVIQAFRERRHEIDAQAENLTEHLFNSNDFGLQKLAADEIFNAGKLDEAVQQILKTADKEWGGFGKAPKFPHTFAIQFLLRYSYSKRNSKRSASLNSPLLSKETGGEAALAHALLSLNKMIEGGIYDQVGGGFSRYSTDTEWLAPHFEKMLYDNALLISVLSEAFQLDKKQTVQRSD